MSNTCRTVMCHTQTTCTPASVWTVRDGATRVLLSIEAMHYRVQRTKFTKPVPTVTAMTMVGTPPVDVTL